MQTVDAEVIVSHTGIRAEEVDSSRENPAEFLLSPGVYDLRATYYATIGGDYRRELKTELREVTVEQEQVTQVSMSFKLGELAISWPESQACSLWGTVHVYPDYQHDEYLARQSESPAYFSLQEGTYDVQLVCMTPTLRESNFWLEDIVVKEGETTEVQLTPPW